jgi:hypothetical protein
MRGEERKGAEINIENWRIGERGRERGIIGDDWTRRCKVR